MYGHQLMRLYETLKELGLARSRAQFAQVYCGRDVGYVRDLLRREGPTSRVTNRTVMTLRMRLAEAATLLPPDLADRVRALDGMILRDQHIANLLSRRTIEAQCS